VTIGQVRYYPPDSLGLSPLRTDLRFLGRSIIQNGITNTPDFPKKLWRPPHYFLNTPSQIRVLGSLLPSQPNRD